MRPKSIVNFDYAYLGSLLVGLINTVVTWQETTAQVSVQRATASFGSWYPYAVFGFSFGVSLLLWYFTSPRASVIAKWILVVLTSIGIALTAMSLAAAFPATLSGALIVLSGVLQAIAMVYLFRPDARAYFGEVQTAEPVA
jgi:hypothetical protein